MSRPIIEVRNLSKRYQLGAIGATSIREEASRLWDRLRGGPPPDAKAFWALSDVSFDIQPGEVVGVIGRNGAGKSTLLKILARITEPTSGTAKLRGRVASLLEIGTGFHPELTGRENVFLNGAILGMTRVEVRKKFDEIVAFAEVAQFIDTPVKRYSSGMYVRLAFAVAAHLEPEILIVDEVLAVGDAQFQKKCLGKMGEVAAQQGRTVLFVSHNMTAMRSLCARALLLDRGSISTSGPIGEVAATYARGFAVAVSERIWPDYASAPGTEAVRFVSVGLRARADQPSAFLTVESAFALEFVLRAKKQATLNLSVEFRLASGETAMVLASPAQTSEPDSTLQFQCEIPARLLNDESYQINVMLVENAAAIFVLPEALVFAIHDSPRATGWLGKWPGALRPQLKWKRG